MSTTGLSQEDLDLLRKFDTPTICNVIEIFDIRPRNAGYMDSRIKACFPEMPPMVGYACTATYRSDAPPGTGDVYSSIDKQVAAFEEIPGPPVVVFQDLDDPSVAATFGEVMCTTYKTFGAVGLVTSGTARDLDQVREIGFPAFSNGAICAHSYCHTLSVNVPVRVGGLPVTPGDLLHGDCNGVTSIPNEIASAVAQVSAEYVEAEEIVLEHLRSGNATPSSLGDVRLECVNVIQELSKRVQA